MMSALGLTRRLGGRRGFFLAAFLAGFLVAVVIFQELYVVMNQLCEK
jgi:hypothetical protein